MGGMAAQIPIKNDPEANDKAMEGVRADKLREVRAGHDGYVSCLPSTLSLFGETPGQLTGPDQ